MAVREILVRPSPYGVIVSYPDGMQLLLKQRELPGELAAQNCLARDEGDSIYVILQPPRQT